MEFRPCIDIHNGLVKQIVGSSLQDEGDVAQENFVSKRNADFFAKFYAKDGLKGGHVIMLNRPDSPYYEKTKQQALLALAAYPGGLQIGGGITAENAGEFLAAGASHVIVTSYVFSDGKIDYDHLEKLVDAVGKEHVVLDLSCRRMDEDEDYYVVTEPAGRNLPENGCGQNFWMSWRSTVTSSWFTPRMWRGRPLASSGSW